MRVPKVITQALIATGMPHSIEIGGRHRKIFIDRRLIGILPYGKINEADRATKNILAQIKRTAG